MPLVTPSLLLLLLLLFLRRNRTTSIACGAGTIPPTPSLLSPPLARLPLPPTPSLSTRTFRSPVSNGANRLDCTNAARAPHHAIVAVCRQCRGNGADVGELGKRLYDVQGQLGYYPGDLHRVRGGFGVNLHEQVGLRFFFFFFPLSRSSRPTNRCSFGQLASFRSLPYTLICSDMCMAPANDATNPVNYIDPGFQVRALCDCPRSVR